MAYYLPKVVEEAVRLHHPEVFIGDMIQEGNIVLMLALKEIRKEKDEEENFKFYFSIGTFGTHADRLYVRQ